MHEVNREFIDKYVGMGGYEATKSINDTMKHILKLADPLLCHSVHHFTLPDCATEHMRARLLYIVSKSIILSSQHLT